MYLRGRNEAEILARTFVDRLIVKRSRWILNPETQESEEVFDIIYEDIPCAYSQASNSIPDRRENHSIASRESVIFTAPGILILDNDIAIITTEAGPVYQGKTGKTFAYISHGETPFAVEAIT